MMSSRRPSKAYVMPGRVLGVTPVTICSSPQRKSRVNSKRSAGTESILRSTAPEFHPRSTVPSAPAPPLTPGAIDAAKKAARQQKARSTSKSKSGSNSVATTTTSATSSAAADPPSHTGPAARSKGVRVDESKNAWKTFSEQSDDESEWEDASSIGLGDDKPAAGDPKQQDNEMASSEDDDEHIGNVEDMETRSAEEEGDDSAAKEPTSDDIKAADTGDDNSMKSSGTSSSEESEEPKELDEKKNFYWAVYSKLNVKEMKALLQLREQGTSGTKAALARRLESGDRTRLAKLLALGRKDKLQSHEDNIASPIEMKNRGDRSLSRERGRSNESKPPSPRDPSPGVTSRSSGLKGKPSKTIEIESGTDDDDDKMSVASSAEPLCPQQQSQPPPSPKKKKKSINSSKPDPATSPPATIATKSTASATQSTVSSLNTPATLASSASGRLLNTRPRRDPTVDGVANFVSIMSPPCKKSGEPATACHATLSKAFAILKKNDPDLAWYPIWDPEPGCDPIPPSLTPKSFHQTLTRHKSMPELPILGTYKGFVQVKLTTRQVN
eukprot:scaffold35605_cov41-Cyclotella_meneghiniana.AAC.5